MKIRLVGVEVFHADRWMDGSTRSYKSLFAILQTRQKISFVRWWAA